MKGYTACIDCLGLGFYTDDDGNATDCLEAPPDDPEQNAHDRADDLADILHDRRRERQLEARHG